jgi:hypothetical protein
MTAQRVAPPTSAATSTSPAGYRAAIARHGNSWKIEALVAGD